MLDRVNVLVNFGNPAMKFATQIVTAVADTSIAVNYELAPELPQIGHGQHAARKRKNF